MRKAVYPGSFDPITNGHLDIIKRSSYVFDEVIVAVLINPDKKGWFEIDERVAHIQKVIAPYKNVKVKRFSGLLVDFMNAEEADVIVKGLRSMSDFDYEFQMALMNKKLDKTKETVFMMTNSKYSYLSSSATKQVALFGGCLEDLVPDEIKEDLKKRAKIKRGDNSGQKS
ncbi:pantetheine-phosphate adenylyltransferase [Clostridium argentinense CDC 2741]|uniref:Phosphopantetheine adenylyltransferase n=1 Tax=Clostridium argentinense CDC 2741 TaxID=1418104 RepID=A0A0C1R9K7_9CLOT|nr:pantetheine-phosphate adenylyltransferase [Clostridium argentinense]ARC85696.1 pantetheine-phosphate adenylyltransferase [Clostridium argentinense]KIE47126.1 pantetheine-phosphate adenylyltransferase [Clostridium argentinense CDC 2741]NFF40780.1 pantetheine-phosphate adenylyltransferase [Clostridium argentinense]NFP50712.1 pantetheine-phosphate adenylyltransferase [Clostridium argentinense]NFP73131.1 pantetheine-phosphate adenylyltransferase [Clostridium argentinense]